MSRIALLPVLLLVSCCAAVAAAQPAGEVVVRDGPAVVRERPAGALPATAVRANRVLPDGPGHFVAFSPDLRHWATVTRGPRGDSLVQDGKPFGGTYPWIDKVLYTAAGRL